MPLQDNAVIGVVSAHMVTFIDRATQQKSGELTFPGDLRGVATSPTAPAASPSATAD